MILGIDPGTSDSSFVLLDDGKPSYFWHVSNGVLLTMARTNLKCDGSGLLPRCIVAIEMVACYGMSAGKEIFETCLMIGQLKEAFESRCVGVRLVYRMDVKMHLCHHSRAKDANIRQALIDKHGPPGTKKEPGKLYGIKSHLWAALAVADYAASTP